MAGLSFWWNLGEKQKENHAWCQDMSDSQPLTSNFSSMSANKKELDLEVCCYCLEWTQCRQCLVTGVKIFFFLFAAALGPEKSFSRAARAALAFATFLLGPDPRNFCPSTSTLHKQKMFTDEDTICKQYLKTTIYLVDKIPVSLQCFFYAFIHLSCPNNKVALNVHVYPSPVTQAELHWAGQLV